MIFLEYLVINESKLKIIMTPEDAERYELKAQGADYDNPNTRKLFWRILDDAKDAVGFDPKGDKILIQFYPSRDGGCEIFVTKLGALSPSAAKLVTESENVTMLSRARTLYQFENINDLYSAARIIAKTSSPKSEAYCAENGICFLSVEEHGGGESSEYPCINEFAVKSPPEMLYYIREHLNCIAKKSAVSVLANAK